VVEFIEMTLSNWLTILAILLAPLLAVQVQKRLELLRERRQKKNYVFQTLMATRAPATRLSGQHVKALNVIDTEFYGRKILGIQYQSKKEKAVVEAWKIYHDQLHMPYEKKDLQIWIDKGNELFTDLLHKMAQSLGYDFDRVHLKRGMYSPIAHDDEAIDQLFIRKAIAEILSGRKAFPISIPVSPEQQAMQNELNEKLLEYLEGKRPIPVKIEKES